MAKPKATRADGPHIPAPYTLADAGAIQALQRGDATADQQQRALAWLIKQAAGTYEFQFYPSDRETAFALGRAFVGQQIVKLATLDLSSLRRLENEHATHSAESR
jgi:hypothetical protein